MNNDIFWAAFQDEIGKTAAGATYPISRFLTSRRGSALLSAVKAVDPASAISSAVGMPLHAATGAGQQHVDRWVTARATKGRIARGGKGMWGFEKKRLAEAVGTTPQKLEEALKRIQRKASAEGHPTYPVSRAITHSLLPPTNIIGRFMRSRATAGRAKTGYKHFLKQEKSLLDTLRQEVADLDSPKQKMGRALEAIGRRMSG